MLVTGRFREIDIGELLYWCGRRMILTDSELMYMALIADIEKDFGKVQDLHRPFIDSLVRPNPDDPTGKSMMRRIPDVLDCWFESGSMPYAQVHYP